MKEEQRLLIAFLLSLFIIIFFSRLYQRKYVPPTQSSKIPQKVIHEEKHYEDFWQYSDKSINFENDVFIGEIDLSGGKIKNIGLKNYKKIGEQYFYILNMPFSLCEYPEGDLKWQNTFYSYSQKDNLIILEGNPGEKIKIIKKYKTFPSLYTIEYEIEILNNKTEKLSLKNYFLIGEVININEEVKERTFASEILVESNGHILKRAISKVSGYQIFENSSWICLKSKYKLVFLKSEIGKTFINRKDKNIIFGFLYPEINIEPKQSEKLKFSFYSGPSDYFVARKEIKENIFGKGFFASMGKILFVILAGIQRVIPNWGFAIILLTLIIKIVFFPLTKSSLHSMKQIQKLRPYMKDLQTKYKDNPSQMQKELMNLYKEYKINPFSGCIPMLIQIPIFIGFFIALRNSIFLRGAPFIFWIKDLSIPDTVYKIPLKFTIPVIENNINLLPIIMAVTSFWQQKLTPAEPSQKSLTLLMPIMFLFLFYNFPSGLLLYWVTMNLASLIEHYLIYKK